WRGFRLRRQALLDGQRKNSLRRVILLIHVHFTGSVLLVPGDEIVQVAIGGSTQRLKECFEGYGLPIVLCDKPSKAATKARVTEYQLQHPNYFSAFAVNGRNEEVANRRTTRWTQPARGRCPQHAHFPDPADSRTGPICEELMGQVFG